MPFFDPQYHYLNERTLIDAQGHIHRPDKVVLTPNEVWIVDYKFSDFSSLKPQDHEKHQAQLRQYKNLLSDLYTLPIKTYLIYFEGKIQCVEVV